MKAILIIGGGISGVTAAVELAEAGKEVILLERGSHLGGNVLTMNSYFPKLCPPACGMELNFRRIKSNKRIQLMTHSEVLDISGSKGNFTVKVRRDPQYISDNCTACGECVEVCPAERPDDFNRNLTSTKAVFIPHKLAFPRKYEIDDKYCEGISCSKCLDACAYEAIDLNSRSAELVLNVHSVIAATGWKSYDASNISEFNYLNSADIVTNTEFERLLSSTGPGQGALKRLSDGKTPESIAFIQCAGSRDTNHLPYCSAVCCSASLKHALNVNELLPAARLAIFYIDLRVSGRNEDFLQRVEEVANIDLIKGKVASVMPRKDKLSIEVENIQEGKKLELEYDMVVLATGIENSGSIPGFHLGPEGFFNVEQTDGLYVAACCKKPMDVSSSVKDATAAALKSMKI